jgi:rhomboid family GlyGly-CTERM serine protease
MMLASMPIIQAWLAYDADAFAQGQWWRAFSSWVTQLNLRHWLLNQWGLLAMWLLLPASLKLKVWLGLGFVWLFASVCLMLSNYDNYVGLSGLLYGWLVVCAVQSPFYERWVKWVFVLILSVKVISENLGLSGLEENWVGEFISATVAHESHLWGWLGGVSFSVGLWTVQRFRSAPTHLD